MVIIKFVRLLLLIIFQESYCERRIVEGEQASSEKSYMVYLVKAKMSEKRYDSWLCGGALVSKEFIITSAACVEDVHYMYAIAGYRKYVSDQNLEDDACTKEMKKKIVYTCVPIGYEFDFDMVEKWSYIDIALVKVESPYNFDDARFEVICSYLPSIIPINYDAKRQATNVDAMVLGWGHTEFWRQQADAKNYNQEYLRYTTTMLYDKNKCQQEYKYYPEIVKTIEKYMICSLEPGFLNDYGLPYSKNQKPLRNHCITQNQKSMGSQGVLCEGEAVEAVSNLPEQDQMDPLWRSESDTRKRMSLHATNNNDTNTPKKPPPVKRTDFGNEMDIYNETDIDNGTDIPKANDSVDRIDFSNVLKPVFGRNNKNFSRRSGICQNDHGGPLVTWVGKREVLIGVASVFKINEDGKCIGPYLYTSTMCNGAFIGCILGDKKANRLRGQNESVSTRKALLCDSPASEKGFDTIESYVSWKDHPDGPADNEKPAARDILQPKKKDRYATIVKQDSEQEEQKSHDRFSLKIGIPPKRRPPLRKRPLLRKRPPSEMEPPPIKRPLPKMKPALLMRPQMKMESAPILRPVPRMDPPPIMGPAPTISRPSPIVDWPPPDIEHSPIEERLSKTDPLPYEVLSDFKSEEELSKDIFNDKPNPNLSSISEPVFKLRFQKPLS